MNHNAVLITKKGQVAYDKWGMLLVLDVGKLHRYDAFCFEDIYKRYERKVEEARPIEDFQEAVILTDNRVADLADVMGYFADSYNFEEKFSKLTQQWCCGVVINQGRE